LRRALRTVPGPLWLLIAMSSVLALAWATVTPPLTNADETGHFAYIQHLAETGSAPSDKGTSTLSTEELQLLAQLGISPIINNVNGRPSFSKLDRDAWLTYQRHVPAADRKNGDGPNQFAQNGPFYYAYGAIAYKLTPGGHLVDRVFAVRLAGGLLFVGIVIFTWLLAAELFAQTWPRALAAAVVALQPKLGNAAGMVNPDIMLAFLWSAFAWLGVRTVRRGLTVRRAVVLGVLTGASALTHGRGLALIPPLVVAVGLAIPRLKADWRAYVKPLAWGLGVAFACLVVGFLYTRAQSGGFYGGEVSQATHVNNEGASLRGLFAYVFNFYFGAFGALGPILGAGYGWRQGYIETFFSNLGSLDVVFQPHIVDYLQVLAAIGLLVLWSQVIWFRDLLRARWRVIVVMVAMVVTQIGLLHVASYRDLVQSHGGAPLWSGRYLLPLIAIFGVTIAYVCSHLPRRLAAVSAGVVIGVGVVLQLGSLGLTLDRFYG
jgi:4-amino-4-deoxy-L-arabinose transferase-like glycosyltransferase